MVLAVATSITDFHQAPSKLLRLKISSHWRKVHASVTTSRMLAVGNGGQQWHSHTTLRNVRQGMRSLCCRWWIASGQCSMLKLAPMTASGNFAILGTPWDPPGPDVPASGCFASPVSKRTHLVKVPCITCHLDDRTISHAGRSRVTCAVEGESECDCSNGSLALQETETLRSVLGRVRMSLGRGMTQCKSQLAE